MGTILELKQIQKYYGNEGNITKAINNISFTVEEGEFLGIMGASGSGKTTLLNCISTIDAVSSGHIYLENEDITEIKEQEIARFRRENLGFIFQDFNLLDTLTIEENIALILTINKISENEIDAKILEIARKLGIEEILQGRVNAEVYQRISRAAFDEKISVTGLLLDGLLREMAVFCMEKKLTDAWYFFLKEYRSKVEQAENPKECYLSLLKQEEETLEKKKAADLYTRKEVQLYEKLLAVLKKSCPSGGLGAKESFEEAKKGFGCQTEKLSREKEKTGKITEFAFDFMETAFAAGEEMVLFVTELTLSQEGAVFLSEYDCERYHKYNQELLIGSRRRELLSELER